MVKYLFILLTIYYALVTGLSAASVEAKLANTEVVQGNMAQLRIKVTGDKASFPNISQIGTSQVLGRHESQHNSFSYVNGTMTNIREITLVLTFAPQEDMTIPSYSVMIDGKVYKTKPLALKVVKSTVPKVNGKEQFSLLLRTEKKSVMEGEPFLASVYFSLLHGVRLSENPEYHQPEFKGFFSKELGESKTYNEGNRQVTELTYILTPKTEGNFTVGPATAKIGVADRNKRDMFGRFFGTTWMPIASNTIDIEVKKKPQESDLVGSFTMESQIDTQSTKANKPVNLTVTISGEGSLEDFEFPDFEIDGVTVYSDDAKISTELIDKGIKSTFSKRFVFISGESFTIPARSISVYDTKEEKVKNLELAAYTIEIKEAKTAVSAPTPTASEPNAGKVQTNLKVPKSSMLDGEEETTTEAKQIEWQILVLVFVLGMFIMYLLRYFPRMQWKRSHVALKESEALKILYAHMSESEEIETMVRQLYAKKNGDKSVKIDKKILQDMLDKLRS